MRHGEPAARVQPNPELREANMSDWQRFNEQFRETPGERNERLRDNRLTRTLEHGRRGGQSIGIM